MGRQAAVHDNSQHKDFEHPPQEADVTFNVEVFFDAFETTSCSKDFAGTEIGCLMDVHASALEELASLAERDAHFDPHRHDRLYLLRFLLSHRGNVTRAATAFSRTASWRSAMQLDRLGDAMLSGQVTQKHFPHHAEIAKHAPMHLARHPETGQTILYFLDVDLRALMAHVSADQFIEYQTYLNEWCYVHCDLAQRFTGRLLRHVRVAELSKATVRTHVDYKFLRAFVKSTRQSEDYYPQLVQRVVLCNMGAFQERVFHSVCMPILPSRLREKLMIISPHRKPEDGKALLDVLPASRVPARVLHVQPDK